MGSFRIDENRLIRTSRGEQLWIEPWGANSIRIRATKMMEMDTSPLMQWALLPQVDSAADIEVSDNSAKVTNSKLTVAVDSTGTLSFSNQHGKTLLSEYRRTKENREDFCSDLNIRPREFLPAPGGDYSLCVRFEADNDEKLYGMGQYQQPFLDLKGTTLELVQRNSQVSIPFVLYSLGYGFFWNNPGIGEVSFSKTRTVSRRARCEVQFWQRSGSDRGVYRQPFLLAKSAAGRMPTVVRMSSRYRAGRTGSSRRNPGPTEPAGGDHRSCLGRRRQQQAPAMARCVWILGNPRPCRAPRQDYSCAPH